MTYQVSDTSGPVVKFRSLQNSMNKMQEIINHRLFSIKLLFYKKISNTVSLLVGSFINSLFFLRESAYVLCQPIGRIRKSRTAKNKIFPVSSVRIKVSRKKVKKIS